MIDGIIKADGTSRLMRATLPETYEGFRAQCAAGTQPLDVLFNAIGWSQLPTFLKKANLMQDDVAALFGKDSGAVPNDLFAWLGQYAQHWWSVLHGQASVAYEEEKTISTNTQYLYCQPPDYTSATVQYADEIAIDQSTGAITLVNPKSIQFTYNLSQSVRVSRLKTLYGKYVKGVPELGDNSTASSTDASSKVFFIPDGASYFAPSDGFSAGFNPQNFYTVTSRVVNIHAGETTYVHSTDRNAYPDSGTVNGLTYQYLGIPFQNAVTAPKIATGSYTGTGKYGASNPNMLAFDFEPKLVFIQCANPNSDYTLITLCLCNPVTEAVTLFNSFGSNGAGNSHYGTRVVVSWSGKSCSFYTTAASSTGKYTLGQMNATNVKYNYVAIC